MKNVKLNDENYLDSTSIVHNKKKLSEVLKEHIITAYPSKNKSGTNNSVIDLDAYEVKKGNLEVLNKKVVIGKGISIVKVSGSIFYQDFSIENQSYLWGKILHNGTNLAGSITPIGTTGYATCSISPKTINVKEGDTIELNFGDVTGKTVSVRGRFIKYILNSRSY